MRQRLVQVVICGVIGILLQGVSFSVWAAPDETEPRYYSRLSVDGQTLYFDSPQAAYNYYKPIWQAQLIKNFGPKGHPDILQELYVTPPSKGSKFYPITINGLPINYSVHILVWQGTPNGDMYVQNGGEGSPGGWIQLLAECPDKTQPIATYPADYQNTLVCRIPEIPHPDNCPNAPTIKVGNPIFAATGRKQQSESDYASASGLTFTRIYRSDANGWTHNQNYAGVDLNSPALELNPEYPPQLCYQGIGATTKLPYCFPYKRKNSSNDFLIRRPDGRLIRFGSLNGMDAPADVNDRVVVIKNQNNQIVGWRVYNTSTNAQETYDMLGRLLSSTNSQNQTVTYVYSDANTPANLAPKPGLLLSITDWQGRELKLSYDAKARLSSMIDPAGGVVTYAYDEPSAIVIGTNPAASNLTSVTYPDGSKRLYHYNEPANTANTNLPNALTGLTDENGTRLADYKYNYAGKALSTEHVGGAGKYSLSYPGGYTQSEVIDPLGSKTTYKFQTILGVSKLTSQSQPAGSGCGPASSSLSYDVQGNIASQVDFTGQKTCHSYELSRNLESIRIEGLPAASACPANPAAYQSLLLPTPALGSTVTQRKVSTQWHPELRLQTKQAQPNSLTTWVYHGQPDPSAGNAIANCAPAQALLPDGKPIAVLCKQIEQATTDVTGSSGFAASAAPGIAPRIWTYTYNERGQVLSADGPRTDNGILDRTTYTYHPATTSEVMQGDLASITNAAGQTTTYTHYDKHGRVLQSVDAKGSTTLNTYHPRGWLLSSISTPWGMAVETAQAQGLALVSSFDYDATGQLLKATLPKGSSVTYSYDAAHRLIGMTDTVGNSITYTLDAMGNRLQEQIKDPNAVLAQQVSRVVDALNRVQQTTGSAQ